MEQQVATLLQQVMEVNERIRLSEESSEQVRQLLEAHRTAGQMLEERMNQSDGSECREIRLRLVAKVREALGAADDGRFGFGAFAARYQPENFSGEDAGWRDWSRVSRTWAGRFQRGRVQEIIRSVEARPGHEATVAELNIRLEDGESAELKCCSRLISRTDSLLQRESVKNCPDQQRRRRI